MPSANFYWNGTLSIHSSLIRQKISHCRGFNIENHSTQQSHLQLCDNPRPATHKKRKGKGKIAFNTEHRVTECILLPFPATAFLCPGLGTSQLLHAVDVSLPPAHWFSSPTHPVLLSFLPAEKQVTDHGGLTGDPKRHSTSKVPSNPFSSQKITVKEWIWLHVKSPATDFPLPTSKLYCSVCSGDS